MLAPPPPDYKPYLVMDELEKQKAAKKPVGKGPAEKLPLSQERSADSRTGVASRAGPTVRKDSADSRSVRTGEYVIMVKEVTDPPFLGHTLPPAFALLRVVPARLKRRASRAEIPGVKSRSALGELLE
ncbi:MORN repeat-containing protein 1-like [Conger conger]|uniref:MORN repeat-containing protein 1-like n=1 Tax=Conger conger TaxID=82655 RepID=UPI002A5A38AB|nr:MORN repeat-containing protein 1-like [Conger conger]